MQVHTKTKADRVTDILDGLEEEAMYRFNTGLVLYGYNEQELQALELHLSRCRIARTHRK
jgi:hypothetical protein